ncbi:MAG: ribulose-phosphate 3-epimerase [Clostridia bacterium]|nr:ribulose-phosphate 3-epimerase [Clostridia bacterium]MBR2973866.1 ribulose-phosphate 3-epimerase [Clostridia bacterium]
MEKVVKISPSLLAADPNCLGSELKKVEDAGAQMIHLDIMDGHFVPNLSFGPGQIKGLRKNSGLIFDVHLMLTDPIDYIDAFADAGADIITFHVEANSDIKECIDKIHSHGIKAGLVIKPDTEVTEYLKYINDIEMILIMSVYPGFGGQKFIPRVLPKATEIRKAAGPDFDIEIDGGITLENYKLALDAGVNVLVAGSSIYNAEDPAAVIKEMMA